MTTSSENESFDQHSFINKLLGEMKTKFNKPDSTENEEMEHNRSKNQEESVTIETEIKKGQSLNVAKTESSPGRRSNRQKNISEEKQDETIKRSSRRKNSRKSVLQNAIARKVKSYNESARPQRLTRQLKPTMKVLENIAQAKDIKKVKMKVINSSTDSLIEENVKDSKNTDILKKCKKNKQFKVKNNKTVCDKPLPLEVQNETKTSCQSLDKSGSLSPKFNSTSEEEEVPELFSTSLISENPELTSRLCLCTQKTNIYPSSSSEEVVYCSAIESIDNTLVGCSKEVNIAPLLRPSRSIPYMRLCNLHKNRLIRHNCCPTCGVFCTQGQFLQCEAKHQFHQKCRLFIGNREYCPHCGVSTPCKDILLKFQCSNHPVFLPFQKSVW